MNKRNKIIIILSAVMIALAIIALVVGFYLSGADIIAWFGSKWAIWIYVFVGAYALIVVSLLIADRIKKL